MQSELVYIITEYRLVIMIGALFLLVIAQWKGKGNKFLLTLIVILALSIGYELVMNEPVSRLPARIDSSLNQPGPTKSSNPHYYIPPEERQK